MHSTISRLMCVLLLFAQILGCGADETNEESLGPDFHECDDQSVDWSAVNPLAWDDALTDEWAFETFDDVMRAIEGEHNVTRGAETGVLEISRSDEPPYQEFQRGRCSKVFQLPVNLVLTQGDKTWEGSADLELGYEHVGYITDREVPAPEFRHPIPGTAGEIAQLKEFPDFNTLDHYPKAPKGEEITETGVMVYVYPNDRVVLDIIVFYTVDGGFEHGGHYDSKTWFEVEGDLMK